ncbi:MAG: hypothetical protein WBB45_16740 [Cyclobacteriaceae bacterium]
MRQRLQQSSFRKFILPGLLILALSWLASCDECEDCTFSENEPFINLRFLDSTTYKTLTEDLAFLNDTITLLDSLENIALDSVNAGNTSYQAELEYYVDLSDSFGQIQQQTSGRRNIISGGSFFPEQIIPVGGSAYPDLPTDTVTALTLTLPMDAGGLAEFYLQIDGRTDTLVLTYRTFVEEKNNEYFVRAIDPDVLETSFPGGAQIVCFDPDSCITDNATVYVYY